MPILLQTGKYTIRAVYGERAIGVAQDLSPDYNNLRSVKALPPHAEAPVWLLEYVDRGFIISMMGDHSKPKEPVRCIDRKVWTLLGRQEPPTIWKIDAQPQHGKNVYTIVDSESGVNGWVSDNRAGPDDSQVKCQPMIIGPSEPPFYPEPERFLITRIN